jgi:hypothetical protein
MVIPLAVSCHTDPFGEYTCWSLPSADSINLASRNLWQIALAISLAMEKVVVVVVVTILVGSLGSGMRLDCENFKEPRLLMASSERKVCSTFVNRTLCALSGRRLTTRVEKRSLKSYMGNPTRLAIDFTGLRRMRIDGRGGFQMARKQQT